jgi:hypothetical protein
MSRSDTHIQLSLVSHTNIGKTTLARTLLGRDIGEVRDQAHVTAEAEVHPLIELADGRGLLLWDTPGFGDSTRLAGRLRQRGNPIGWFLGEVVDRWLNRPLWAGQQVIKNVRDESDVVLYLVNVAENPAEAAYVDAEMEILAWIGKPVIVLLNQVGEPRPAAQEAAERAVWQAHMARQPLVREALALDAFARCWVQELTLMQAVAAAVDVSRQPLFADLLAAWQARRLDTYQRSLQAIAGYLASLAGDSETVGETGLWGKIRQTVGINGGEAEAVRQRAMEALAGRASAALRGLTDELIAIHSLKGRAGQLLLDRLAEASRVDGAASTEGAAVVGGVLAGALSGLSADLMAGGLTLGSGALVGAILGALGGAGVARGYNVITGKEGATARWNEEALNRFYGEALLLYLAVAHFGRGRGDWRRAENPPHWPAEVARQVEAVAPRLRPIWLQCATPPSGDGPRQALAGLLKESLDAILRCLYPASFAGRD